MNKLISALLLLLFSIVYYTGSFAKIPFADCVGFVLEVEKGKLVTTATATSHFLYMNTAILLKNITGLNAIEANRLLVVFSAAATVSVIYLTMKSLTKTIWVSIMTAFIFGFSFTFWKNAEIVEVYTYNTLWVSLFFFSIINSFISKENKYIILSGILLGISLWLHIQNILLVPSYLLFLYYFKAQKSIYFSFLSFLLFFLMLFIVNYSQGLSLNSPFSSDQGHWVEDSFKKTYSQYFQDLIKSIFYLIYNFNILGIWGIVGMTSLYKTDSKMFWVFFVASLFVYGFSTFYAVSDNYVFFLPFNVIFSLSIGYGIFSSRNLNWKKLSWVCLLIPLFYYSCYKIMLLTEQGRDFDKFKKYKGGLEYYMLPWMNNNVGILEFTIDEKVAPEPINWMTTSANEYISILKSKGLSSKQIKEL